MSIQDRGLGETPLPPRLQVLLFRQSKMQPECGTHGHWIHAWNSAIVIRASHNGLSHWQPHIRNQLKGATIAGTNPGKKPCYQFRFLRQVRVEENLVISFLHRAHIKRLGSSFHVTFPPDQLHASLRLQAIRLWQRGRSGFSETAATPSSATVSGRVRAEVLCITTCPYGGFHRIQSFSQSVYTPRLVEGRTRGGICSGERERCPFKIAA